MNKLQRNIKELRGLENELNQLNQRKNDVNIIMDTTEKEIASGYENFFTKKRNKEFVYYDRYPSLEVLQLYRSKISWLHPLMEDKNFNVKELAEIIKQLYQFKRGQEYDILTIGRSEKWMSDFTPQLYFVIGNNKNLEPYKEYNGLYLNEGKPFKFESYKANKDIIAINLDRGINSSFVDIECMTGSNLDQKGEVNYYNCFERRTTQGMFLLHKNIFPFQLCTSKPDYKGIKDTLSIHMHINDSYIAKVLLSICIYKYNNKIEELADEDYNHIFSVLFNEKVNICSQAKLDIPKTLTYVSKIKLPQSEQRDRYNYY